MCCLLGQSIALDFSNEYADNTQSKSLQEAFSAICKSLGVYGNNLLFRFTFNSKRLKNPNSSAELIQKKKYGKTQTDFENHLEIMINKV